MAGSDIQPKTGKSFADNLEVLKNHAIAGGLNAEQAENLSKAEIETITGDKMTDGYFTNLKIHTRNELLKRKDVADLRTISAAIKSGIAIDNYFPHADVEVFRGFVRIWLEGKPENVDDG